MSEPEHFEQSFRFNPIVKGAINLLATSASKAVRITRTINGVQKKVKAKLDNIVKAGDIIEAKASLF